MQTLSVKGLALAAGLLWGGCMAFTGFLNLAFPSYGMGFLTMMDSIYPGFHAGKGLGSIIIGTLYGFLDGAVGGALLAWLYNRLR